MIFSALVSNLSHKSARRRGQALLISVLLMIFVAVLGATFVTIVAANLNQTARSSSENEARLAADAGVRFVYFKMQSEGLAWRPKNENPPPQPEDASFTFYYDEFDKSNGWRTSGVDENDANYHSDGFVRYPDPRSQQRGDALPFLVKAEKVVPNASDNRDNARTGDLRFTIIGRSPNELAAWDKRVVYVRGQNHHPLTSALRTITNWDFANATVPFGQIARINGLNLTLEKGRGNFPASGNVYVLIGDPLSNRGLRGAVVESYTSSTRTLKLAATVTPAPQIGERVEMAGAIGTAPWLDFNGNGTFETARENVIFDLASLGGGTSGGVRANGGLLLFGDVRALNLRAPQNATSGTSVATIRASGGVQLMPFPTVPAAVPTLTVAGEYSNGGTARTLNNATVVPSNDLNFPGVWAGMNADEKSQLVDDGWNRLAEVPSSTRQVGHFTPPDIEAGGAQNRYRRLTQSSRPLSPLAPSSASLYGYGEGIYINNLRDRERVGGGTLLREMTQDELRRMWTSHATSSTLTYLRLGTPSSRTLANRSLEEQHLRGWIGPDEFRARGALIELNTDNTISITLDSRDDTATYNLGAAAHKGWRDANGNLLGHPSSGGVYRQTFAWPKNGVICAEGNIRIRGQANNPPHSLTVVSFNNIYIEGSLSASDKKVLLLAKRNVVLNPTRVLERTDDQTLLRTAITASTNAPVYSINVYDASAFQAGDWVTLDNNSSNAQEVCVASVDTFNNRLNLLASTPVRSSQPALRPVRAKSDPLNSGEPYTRYNRLDRFGQALQRRFNLPSGSSSEVRIALRHSAERRAAVRVPYLDGLSAPTMALLSHKLAANAQTSLIRTPDKNLVVMGAAFALDFWSVMRPMPAGTRAVNYHLNWLAGPTLPVYTFNGVLRNRASPSWRYADSSTQLLFNHYGENPNTIGNLQMPPFYFMASVGNRADATSTGLWPWRPNLKTLGLYDIPMATSVVSTLNGVYSNETASGLRSDIWDNTRGNYERVGQFGFNPIHGAVLPDASSADETEDVATSDQSFYVNYAGSPLVPQSFLLDSRVLDGARNGSNSVALRFNNKIVDGVYRLTDYFDSTSYSGNGGRIPYYNVSRLKLENVGLNAQHQIESLAPAQTLDVRAFVYAQEGSWIVIPNDWYDATVRNNVDADRDGTISRSEQIAAYRFRRNNYSLKFSGAICENQSAIVHASGTVVGTVADWTDKSATVSLNATNFNGPNANNAFRDDLSTQNSNFGTIFYAFDDGIARGLFDDDIGLHLPVAPENA